MFSIEGARISGKPRGNVQNRGILRRCVRRARNRKVILDAHAKGEGPAIVHVLVDPRAIRLGAKLTQAEMAPLMGMSLSGYRKWEQGQRRVSGPAATLLRV